MTLRAAVSADHPALVELWERSVRATHAFLEEADILALRPRLRDLYLPMVELWLVEDAAGRPAGFMGLDGSKVEMLFVEPAQRGQGVGTRLLDHARNAHGALSVDVNEQNPQALGFYLHYGFARTGRSETDSEGRPFPLIHLALTPA